MKILPLSVSIYTKDTYNNFYILLGNQIGNSLLIGYFLIDDLHEVFDFEIFHFPHLGNVILYYVTLCRTFL